MFLTVMERLSSRWQQDMSVGMTHIQRHREAQSRLVVLTHNHPNKRSVGLGMRRGGLLGDVDRDSFEGKVGRQNNKQQ